MVEQASNKKENVSPGRKGVSLGRKSYTQADFPFLEKVSLSSIFGQKDCLTLLCCLTSLRSVRQLLRSVRQPVLLPYDLGK